MKGEEDIVINNGAVLELAYGAKVEDLTTNKERKIIVKNGGKLIVQEDAMAEIFCKVLVEAGGEFIIQDNCFVRLNEFEIKHGGKFYINQESWLSLEEDKTNKVGGELYILGTDDKHVKITSKVTDCSPSVSNNLKILIHATGCYEGLNADYTNANLEFSIEYFYQWCTNHINRHRFETISLPPYTAGELMPSLMITGSPSNGIAITISNCTFTNITDDPAFNLENSNVGIQLNNVNDIIINNCTFENLFKGVSAESCTFVKLSNNTFTNGIIGYQDRAVSSVICSNTFTTVDYGNVHIESFGGNTFNNDYIDNRFPIFDIYNQLHKIRANKFDEYVVGIYSIVSDLQLGDQYTSYQCLEQLGRNTFDLQPDKFLNRFNPPYRIDVEAFPADLVNIADGENKFSDFSDYHLSGLGSIRVLSNNYPPLSEVRYEGVNLLDNIDLQTSSSFTRICDEICAIPIFYPNYEAPCWDTLYGQFLLEQREIVPGSPEMEALFEHFSTIMNDTLLPCWCRQEMLTRALHTALLNDSLDWRLSQLINEWRNSFDCNSTDSAFRLLKAQIYTRLGLYDLAQLEYEGIASSYPDGDLGNIALIISKIIKSKKLSLSSISYNELDSNYVINDSLVALADSVYTLSNQMLHAFLDGLPHFPVEPDPLNSSGNSDSTADKGIIPDIDKEVYSGALEVNLSPNPVVDVLKLELRYDKTKDISIEIYNSKSQRMLLYEIGKAKNNIIDIDVSMLPIGVYFATIKSGTEIITKQFVIMR